MSIITRGKHSTPLESTPDRSRGRRFTLPPDSTDPNTIFPITVYMNAHLKIRVAMELAFEGSMAEARSIMRDAVEYAAHAHHMLKDPKLQEIWLNKLDDPAAWQAEFWNDKATKLFDGLPLLNAVWKHLSNLGSHANIVSMCERLPPQPWASIPVSECFTLMHPTESAWLAISWRPCVRLLIRNFSTGFPANRERENGFSSSMMAMVG